jgi:hypothetical protein
MRARIPPMSTPSLTELLQQFPHVHFHPEVRLLTWHPRGVLDDALADQMIELVESDAIVGAEPFLCYTELNELSEIRLKIGHIFQIAEHRNNAELPVMSAFVAGSVVGYGIARMYEDLMKDASVRVRAFRERAAAADWLRVPVELLGPR